MGSAPGHAAGAGQTGTGHRAGPGVATNPATITVNVAKLDALKVFGLASTANRDVSNVGPGSIGGSPPRTPCQHHQYFSAA